MLPPVRANWTHVHIDPDPHVACPTIRLHRTSWSSAVKVMSVPHTFTIQHPLKSRSPFKDCQGGRKPASYCDTVIVYT